MYMYDAALVTALNPSGQVSLKGKEGGLVVSPVLTTTPVLGVGQGTVTTSAVAMSTLGAIPSGARIATVYADGAQVRARPDGVSPTTSVGILIPNPGNMVFDGVLADVRLIAVSGSAQVFVVYQ